MANHFAVRAPTREEHALNAILIGRNVKAAHRCTRTQHYEDELQSRGWIYFTRVISTMVRVPRSSGRL
jgi:hypothetical protein